MEEEGIRTGEGQIIYYDNIICIYHKPTRGWGLGTPSIKAIEIVYNNGNVVINDILLGEADEFLYAAREKIEEHKNGKKTIDNLSLDNIKKAKELLAMGAITEEEFEKIKEKYLGML